MARPKKPAPNRADGRYEIKKDTGKLDANGNPIRKSFYSRISLEDCNRQKGDKYLNGGNYGWKPWLFSAIAG